VVARETTVTLELELPYPPTVNTYWRRKGRQVFITPRGQLFRESVWLIAKAKRIQPIAGRLSVELDMYPPDQRQRDIDNVCKAVLDALQHAGVYEDDGQIDRLLVQRRSIIAGGKAIARVSTIRE
jgi:crossover junction endodeoxyribonuclease RusA